MRRVKRGGTGRADERVIAPNTHGMGKHSDNCQEEVVFERALDGLHVKKQKALREEARTRRRLEYERQLILAAKTADAPEPAPYFDDYETEESESLDGWG